jgi:hypothetical protein
MRFMSRWFAKSYCLMVALCIMATSGVVLAQSATVTQSGAPARADTITRWMNCQENYDAPGALARCWMTLTRNRLEQGEHHQVLAIARAFHPIDLRHFVAGKEALRHAQEYRTRNLWFAGFGMTGVGLLSASLIARHDCWSSLCRHGSQGQLSRTGIYVGAGLMAISIPFRLSALHAGQQAVDAYNALLERAK